jgi:DNA modification methylase
MITGGSAERRQDHPAQKPVLLTEIPIRNHTKPGDAVYDPFLGSGTTLIAAERHARVCYGFEIDPVYCDVIVARWERFSGRVAERSGPPDGTDGRDD